MAQVEQIVSSTVEESEDVADPALAARLRRIDAALVEHCEHHIAQDQRFIKIEDAIGRQTAAIEDGIGRLTHAIERQNALLEQWLEPGLDLRGLLAQAADAVRTNSRLVLDLSRQLAEEHAATRSAIDLAIGAASMDALLEQEIA